MYECKNVEQRYTVESKETKKTSDSKCYGGIKVHQKFNSVDEAKTVVNISNINYSKHKYLILFERNIHPSYNMLTDLST